VIIILIVQLIQFVGDRASARVDHRSAATAGSRRSRRQRPLEQEAEAAL
jgi:D-methionine transport system permease protein